MRSTEELKPGEKVGRYALVRELGRGAMGTVFLAEDTLLHEQLAVKVLHPHLTRHPEAVARFHREIVLARRIAHKSVCRLFELHGDDSLRFITMEYVDGHSLRELLSADAPPMTLERIQKILSRVCDALAAAHDVGVIHRDLKPRNIMIRADDEVSLLDFGIATAVDGGSTLTMPGVPIGTRHFIAPEVWAGRPATPRSDQYAVGVMLYACLTGRMPFRAKQELFLLDEMRKGPPPPPSSLRMDVDSSVDRVALRALAFSPEDRFADVRALAAALVELKASALRRTDEVPTLAQMRTLSSGESSSDPSMGLSHLTGPSLDEIDPLVAPTLSPVTRLPEPDADFFRDGEAGETRALTMPGTTQADASLTVRGPAPARAALAAVAVLAVVAVVIVVATLHRDQAAPIAVARVDAGDEAPHHVVSVDAGVAVVESFDFAAEPPVALPVEPAVDKPRPKKPDKPDRPDNKVDVDKQRYIAAKVAFERALADKGLALGDDAEIDRVRARLPQLVAARRFTEATQQAEDATVRASSFVVDKAFVKKKLVRFNQRFDDVKDPALRDKLDAVAKGVLEALQRNAVPDANRQLNDGFSLAKGR